MSDTTPTVNLCVFLRDLGFKLGATHSEAQPKLWAAATEIERLERELVQARFHESKAYEQRDVHHREEERLERELADANERLDNRTRGAVETPTPSVTHGPASSFPADMQVVPASDLRNWQEIAGKYEDRYFAAVAWQEQRAVETPARKLEDDELVRIAAAAGFEDRQWRAMFYEKQPYDLTVPTVTIRRFAELVLAHSPVEPAACTHPVSKTVTTSVRGEWQCECGAILRDAETPAPDPLRDAANREHSRSDDESPSACAPPPGADSADKVGRQVPGRIRDALSGLVGLIELFTARDDLTPEQITALLDNHRYLEAHAALTGDEPSALCPHGMPLARFAEPPT